MNKYNKDELEKLIIIDNISYEEIGRMYKVSGNAIKKAAKRLNISLPKRRVINDKETFSKPRNHKIYLCANCNSVISDNKFNRRKFCNSKCCGEYRNKSVLNKWLDNKSSGTCVRYRFSKAVKQYLLEKCEYKCEVCGFEGYNKRTNNTILQIHHKDGDCTNTKEDNLLVLCPNCHAMTENFGSLNKNSKRNYRKLEYNTQK